MVSVTVYDNNLELALKKFKKKGSSILAELKWRARYSKPSERRRHKRLRAQRRRLKSA